MKNKFFGALCALMLLAGTSVFGGDNLQQVLHIPGAYGMSARLQSHTATSLLTSRATGRVMYSLRQTVSASGRVEYLERSVVMIGTSHKKVTTIQYVGRMCNLQWTQAQSKIWHPELVGVMAFRTTVQLINLLNPAEAIHTTTTFTPCTTFEVSLTSDIRASISGSEAVITENTSYSMTFEDPLWAVENGPQYVYTPFTAWDAAGAAYKGWVKIAFQGGNASYTSSLSALGPRITMGSLPSGGGYPILARAELLWERAVRTYYGVAPAMIWW